MDYRFVSVPAFAVGEDLSHAWDRLCDRIVDARPESRPAWVGAADRFRPEGRTQVHAAFAGRDLVAVFPVATVQSTVHGIPCKVAQGPAQDDSHATDALIRPDHRTPGLIRAWVRHLEGEVEADLIRFPSLPVRSALREVLPQAGLPYVQRAVPCARVVDVRSPESLERLSRRKWRDLDRLRRRAVRDHGPLRCRSFERPEPVLAGLDLFLTLEASGWKGEWDTLSALAHRRGDRLFYETVMTGLAARGAARVDVLYAGTRPVSGQLAVRGGGTWHLLRIGYDETFRRIGPGGLLLRSFLEEVAADPSIEAVHLGTAPDWSDRWHMDEVGVVDLQIFRPTRRGRLLLAAARAEDRIGTAPGQGGPRLAS
ncbi:MAG: GNAT family N-acetyltransferase [Gemmatimonadetes bacterium]|nr:GNAT family N-acetyltransferase [Gemmatimonadota bacterium]